MKKVTTSIILILLCIISLQAQIKKPNAKLPNKPFPITSSNLDLEQIKGHIKAGTFCYETKVSTTAIIPPKSPRRLKAIDGHYSTRKYLKVELSYLRTNGLMLRSDKSFDRHRGDNYEVLIYPDRSDKRKVDKNQVKVTWRTAEMGLRTFNLNNVSVQYKPYGILIIGDYETDGTVLGVSIALTPSACLK